MSSQRTLIDRLSLSMWILITVSPVATVVGQELPAEPQLVIEGPADQTVIVVVRYFDGARVAKTVVSRVDLRAEPRPQPLEFGHAGIRLLVAVPTKEAVTVRLLDGQTQRASTSSNQLGWLELTDGSVLPSDDFEMPRALLDESERTWVKRFLAALAIAQTHPLVSDLSAANIEWQTLDAYCEALTRELGNPSIDEQLDGWLTWEGNLGARVLAGQVSFERGTCRFELMRIGGKLVDINAQPSALDEDWFRGPSSEAKYIAQSRQLAENLFAGRVPEARALFSSRYHQEITMDVLASLRDQLHEQFGQELSGIELGRTELGDYDPESESRTLSVIHALTLKGSDKRCISRVNFEFPCGPNTVSRGHLASITFRESWQSAHPTLAEMIHNLLRSLSSEEVLAGDTRVWDAVLHPSVLAEIPAGQLTEFSKNLHSLVGGLDLEPDWDQWTSKQVRGNIQAEGPATLGGQISQLQVDFSEGKLVGLTVMGDRYAASTLDLVSDSGGAAEVGRKFWTRLLAGELPAAHALLAPVFQEQLPLEEFRSLVAESDLKDMPKVRRVRIERVRLADRPQRALPAMLATYYLAEFEAGGFQPLRCEFRKSEKGPELLNFSTDFESRMPSGDWTRANALVNAFRSGQPEEVIALIAEKDQSEIDAVLLGYFMRHLHEVLGPPNQPASSSVIYQYTTGARVERIRTIVDGPQTSIPLSAVFQYGSLKSFEFTSAKLAYFVDQIDDMSSIETAGLRFLESWLTGDDVAGTAPLVVRSLRTDPVGNRLVELRSGLGKRLGDYQSGRLVTHQVSDTDNAIVLTFEAHFAQGDAPIGLTFEVDAFSALISSIELLED